MPAITDNQQRSLDIVKEFYAAKERHDLDAVVSLLADDVVYNFPLNASGTPEPWFTYDGKQATVDYQRATLARFSRIHMVDPEYTVSPDGDLVFATMKGDYVQGDGNRSYNNVYVFRFAIDGRKIKRVDEYANPVTFAKLADFRLNRLGECTANANAGAVDPRGDSLGDKDDAAGEVAGGLDADERPWPGKGEGPSMAVQRCRAACPSDAVDAENTAPAAPSE